MRDSVARIRRLLEEATARVPTEGSYEEQMKSAYERYVFNEPLPPIPQSPRDRAEREVLRLSSWYGWQRTVEKAMDLAEASSLSALSDEELFCLRDELRRLEDCAQHGLGAPDAPLPG